VRILVASRVFPPDVFSGASTVVWNIWERLREEHDVRLVCGWQYDASLLPRGARGVRIDGQHRLRSRAAMDLAVRREARSFRPDVVLAHGLEVPVDLAPTVGLLTDPGDDSGSWGRLGVARRKLVRSRIEKMAIPVVPTEAARTRWIEFGVRADRLRVAWPGVDTSLFSPDESVPPLPSGTSDEPIRLLYAARITPGKAQHVAIEAVKGLHESVRSRVLLDIVGPVVDPTYFEGLKRRAADAPVRFHESVPDLAPWYRQAHIVLFPTVIDEVFGYSAVDGMACGKPVIHSSSAALLEVTDGCGLSVPAGDVKRLGSAIRELTRSADRCQKMGAEGRALAIERYSWAQALERYGELILEAAARA